VSPQGQSGLQLKKLETVWWSVRRRLAFENEPEIAGMSLCFRRDTTMRILKEYMR
jgi:hypothetical protein